MSFDSETDPVTLADCERLYVPLYELRCKARIPDSLRVHRPLRPDRNDPKIGGPWDELDHVDTLWGIPVEVDTHVQPGVIEVILDGESVTSVTLDFISRA